MLKNNGAKIFLIFDDSCEENNSINFVDIPAQEVIACWALLTSNTACFIRVVQYVVLQSTHIVLLISPRDVMRVTIHSAELHLAYETAELYREAKSYGHLFIYSLSWIEDWLSNCKDAGSLYSKFKISELFKYIKTLDDECTKSFYSPSVPMFFGKSKTQFLQPCPREVIQFFCEGIANLFKRNLQISKRHQVAKFGKEVRMISPISKKSNREANRRRSGIRKKLKNINRLSASRQ